MQVEDVVWIFRRRRAVPHRCRDDPRVHLDALSVRGREQRLQRVKTRSDRFVHRQPRTKAEAVATAYDLGHDRVRVGGLGRTDKRVDLGLVVDALAEGVRPERAELAGRCCRPDRSDLRRERRERAGEVNEYSRKRGELQRFPFPTARNGLLTPSLRAWGRGVKRPSEGFGEGRSYQSSVIFSQDHLVLRLSLS
jgi:hypothetical protein